jgi:hypothetical protein
VERISSGRGMADKPFDSFIETDCLQLFYRKNIGKLKSDQPDST